jgi:hypothetical protein
VVLRSTNAPPLRQSWCRRLAHRRPAEREPPRKPASRRAAPGRSREVLVARRACITSAYPRRRNGEPLRCFGNKNGEWIVCRGDVPRLHGDGVGTSDAVTDQQDRRPARSTWRMENSQRPWLDSRRGKVWRICTPGCLRRFFGGQDERNGAKGGLSLCLHIAFSATIRSAVVACYAQVIDFFGFSWRHVAGERS